MSVTWASNFPTLTVEAGFTTAASGFAIWDTSLWNTGTWGPDQAWVDISAYLLSVSTNLGRSRESDRYRGSMTLVLDNRTGRFTPANLSGPYVAAGISQIRPLVPIRARATWNGITYPLGYGFVDDWQDDFPEHGKWATTTVPCLDAWSLLAAFDGLEQSEVGGGETSGKRIQRIIANAGWTLPASIDVGTITVQPTTLAQNASTDVLLTSDSEGGAVWVDPDGTLVFEDRFALIEHPRSNTSRVTFGTTIPFKDPVLSIGADRIVNMVAFARAGGTAQLAVDDTSRALYRDRRYSRFDLICETDTQVLGLAQLELARRKDAEYRVVQLTVQGAAHASTVWPWALGLRIRDRVTATFTVPVNSVAVTNNLFVEGISHRINRDRTWETTFTFSSATPYAAFSPSGWSQGVWNTANWFF